MFKKMLTGLGLSVLAAALVAAQGAPAPAQGQDNAPQGQGRAGGRGGGRAGGGAGGGAGAAAGQGQDGAAAGRGGGRGGNEATAEQWANPNPEAAKWIAEAKRIAGNDPDLQFDAGVFCQAGRGASGDNRATVGVPNSEPKLQPYPAPNPAQVVGLQRLFDNFYWVGNTGIGAWIITSDDGYIVYDAMNNTADARDVIVPAMEKGGLDPKKIKYLVFGHYHGDHVGGGRYLQKLSGAKAIQHWADWELYLRPFKNPGGTAGFVRNGPPAPEDLEPMTRDIDATNGMEITIGSRQKVTATLYLMSAHTPGSMGMIVPVRYQGREHPILIITAGNAFNNINAYIGAYEYIFGEGIKRKVESVMQAHPNTNMNLLARTKYVNDNYPPAKNPLLYGAEKTEKYLNIVQACSRAFIALQGML
jgi:metallo-beta-lactamase class B